MPSEDFLSNSYSQHLDNHILDSREAGWNKLDLVYELEPAGEMPETLAPHHILIVSQGDFIASFYLDGQWHCEQYAKGDLAFLPAGSYFPRVKIDREVPLIDLFLTPDVLMNATGESAFKTELQSQLKFQDPLIQQMALSLKTELALAGKDSKLYADSMATALGVHLLQRYGVKNSVVKKYSGGLSNYQLKIVIDYIQGHLDRDLSLDLLASQINFSSHYFASLFKQSTGISPHKYITKCRLERAKILLRRQDLAISLVCQEVGFKNQSHFTRVFRQHFGISPKSYQNLF